MAVDAFASVRQAIRIKLQDSAGTYWSDDELDQYINDAQNDFALRTKSLLKNLPIINLENSEIYDFPDDYLEMVRMTDKNGDEIPLTNWKWLRDQYGERFHKDTAEIPLYAYTDLTPKGKFRMYPTPDPKVQASMTEFADAASPYYGYFGFWDSTDYPLRYKFCAYKEGVVFINDQDEVWYWVYGSAAKLIATSQNGIMAAGKEYIWIFDPVTGNISKMSESLAAVTAASGITASVANLPKIFSINPTLGVEFIIICDVSKTYRITLTNAGVLASQEITFGGNSSTLLGFGYNPFPVDSENVWFVVSIGGAKKMYYGLNSTIASATNLTAGAFATADNYHGDIAVDRDTNYYFLQQSGTDYNLFKGTTGAPSLLLSLVGYFYSSALTPSFTNPFYYDSVQNKLYISAPDFTENSHPKTISVDLDTLDIEEVYLSEIGTTYGSSAGFVLANGIKYTMEGNDDNAIQYFVSAILSDEGFLVNVDDEAFESEEGIITDIIDTDDTALFDGQEGAVVQVIDTDESCNLWYARKPAENVLEFTYILPLVYYSVMQAYLKEADMQNFAKAQVFQQLYQTEVNRTNGRKSNSRPVLHTN